MQNPDPGQSDSWNKNNFISYHQQLANFHEYESIEFLVWKIGVRENILHIDKAVEKIFQSQTIFIQVETQVFDKKTLAQNFNALI